MGKKTIVIAMLFAANFCKASEATDTVLLASYLKTLTGISPSRSYDHIAQLNETAAFIQSVFKTYADSVSIQTFTVNGQQYKNVIGSFGTGHKKRIVVGAHYDVCEHQPGADDNASGVAGLLEIARLLHRQPLTHRIDLVAYTLEEPPFFRTGFMGSYVHARSLANNKADVYGMVSLEMIGYFREERKTQSYPVKLLSLFYGSRGNYITLVKKFGGGRFTRQWCRTYKATNAIRTKKFAAPASVPGIDFSDHLNYWKFGFPALMITDTSFYRNKNYHQSTDTIETLDLVRMSKVIDGVYQTLISL